MTAKPFLISLALAGAVALSGCQSSSSTSNFGLTRQVNICSGFGCIYKQTLLFDEEDMAHMRTVMQNGAETPESERRSISELVAWKERLAQKKLRMRQDTRLSYQRDAGIRGQMDCVDESSNTFAFLKFLQGEGLLRHHKAKRVAERGFLFDGRYPHRTAVVTDSAGREWVVDSWKKNGGEEPQVTTYAKWKVEWASEYH